MPQGPEMKKSRLFYLAGISAVILLGQAYASQSQNYIFRYKGPSLSLSAGGGSETDPGGEGEGEGENNERSLRADDNSAVIRSDRSSPLLGGVLGNATPSEGATLAFSQWRPSAAQYGTFTDLGAGAYSYQLDTANPLVAGLTEGAELNETFPYDVGDSKGGLVSASLTIRILGGGAEESRPSIDVAFVAGTVYGGTGSGRLDSSFTASSSAGQGAISKLTVVAGGNSATVDVETPSSLSVNGQYGYLKLVSYDKVSGAGAYEYVLFDPASITADAQDEFSAYATDANGVIGITNFAIDIKKFEEPVEAAKNLNFVYEGWGYNESRFVKTDGNSDYSNGKMVFQCYRMDDPGPYWAYSVVNMEADDYPGSWEVDDVPPIHIGIDIVPRSQLFSSFSGVQPAIGGAHVRFYPEGERLAWDDDEPDRVSTEPAVTTEDEICVRVKPDETYVDQVIWFQIWAESFETSHTKSESWESPFMAMELVPDGRECLYCE